MVRRIVETYLSTRCPMTIDEIPFVEDQKTDSVSFLHGLLFSTSAKPPHILTTSIPEISSAYISANIN